MNAKERAEKIARDLNLYWSANMFTKPNIEMIAAQIEEAEREVRRERDRAFVGMMLRARREGFRAAREKAKGIVLKEDYEGPTPLPFLREITQRIQDLQP